MRELNMLELNHVSGGNPIMGAVSTAIFFGILGCLATPLAFWVDCSDIAPYIVLGFISVGGILGLLY